MKKSEIISTAIGMLPDELITEAESIRNGIQKSHNKIYKSVMAIAACLAFMVAGTALIAQNSHISEKGDLRPTAQDIASEKNTVIPETTVSAQTAETTAPEEYFIFTDIAPPKALAQAVYPEAAMYPEDRDFFDAEGDFDLESYMEYTEPWRRQNKDRFYAGKKLFGNEGLKNFCRVISAEYLAKEGSDDLACSPVNIYMALSMLAEITDGNSRGQIIGLLGAYDIGGVRRTAKKLWDASYRNDGLTVSVPANSLWLNDSYPLWQSSGTDFNTDTLNSLAENYFASVYSGDFSSEDMTKALQNWLNEQTCGLLSESVKGAELSSDSVMDICSTVCFRAKWYNAFDPENNDIKTFHSPDGDIRTEFMNACKTDGHYYAGEDFGAINLPFEDGGEMWLILPDEDKTVNDILRSGEYLDLNSNWENRKYIRINCSLPKFDLSCDTDLTDGLKALGVTDIFDAYKADFTPLAENSGGTFLNKADHSVRVVIDENGCTAAAFTHLGLVGAGLPPEDMIDFILDRPFVFMIKSDTDQPLFIGKVNTP